jgi:protein PET100, animal type
LQISGHLKQFPDMGGFALEIGKMAMYMTFPVAMFYWFNRPEYFEQWVNIN